MKYLPLIFILCFAEVSKAQQNSFLAVPNGNPSFYGLTAYTLTDLFNNPEEYGGLDISPAELDSITGYDFSKLINLELIHIQYSFDPNSSDAEKEKFRKMTKERFGKLKSFSVCPKLKRITFLIGEEIYVNQKEMKPKNALEENEYEICYHRLIKENFRNAWKDFGKDLNESLPDVKLYAENWGW